MTTYNTTEISPEEQFNDGSDERNIFKYTHKGDLPPDESLSYLNNSFINKDIATLFDISEELVTVHPKATVFDIAEDLVTVHPEPTLFEVIDTSFEGIK